MPLRASFASCAVISVIGCSAQNAGTATMSSSSPGASVRAEASTADESLQRERDLKEAIERNRSRPAFTAEELHEYVAMPDNKAHLQLWRDFRSYYALLAIAEGIIEPEVGRIRRQDIQGLLGKGSPDYPGSQGRTLEYAGNRHLPMGSIC
jgi:hypothetical protein